MGRLVLKSRHRVKCGDSTNADHVAECLAGNVPFILTTDPPYGVDYDPNWRNEAAEAGHIAYSASRVGEVANDHRDDWTEAYKLFPGAVGYCWHADRHASNIQQHLEASGFEMRSQIIWSKSKYPISRGHYHWRHEPCWYVVRKGMTAKWTGARDQTTVWEVNLDKNVEGGHSTQKPVELFARALRNHGGPEDHVYDPFLGSGTAMAAAQQMGRRCFGLEIEPRYADVIVLRFLNLAPGQEAVLESTGETFTQVKARREAERAANPPPPEPSIPEEPSATIPEEEAQHENPGRGKKRQKSAAAAR